MCFPPRLQNTKEMPCWSWTWCFQGETKGKGSFWNRKGGCAAWAFISDRSQKTLALTIPWLNCLISINTPLCDKHVYPHRANNTQWETMSCCFSNEGTKPLSTITYVTNPNFLKTHSNEFCNVLHIVDLVWGSVSLSLHIKKAGLHIRHRAERYCCCCCCVKRSGKLNLKQCRKGLNLLAWTVCKWDYAQLNCIIYVLNNSIIITGLKWNYTVISISKWLGKVENKYPILLMNISNHRVDSQWKHPKQICVLEKGRKIPPRWQVCVSGGGGVVQWVGVLPGWLHTFRLHFPNPVWSKMQFPTLATHQ